MAKRIDSAMQFVPTFVREEVEHDLARGRRGPFSDAVVPLNDALVERADRIRTLESVVARLKAEREADRAAMRRALKTCDDAHTTFDQLETDAHAQDVLFDWWSQMRARLSDLRAAITDLRQRLEGTT